ncbi:TlpA disulfide reductase family protein [uncultured Bacteroides sp.]|uniref:TlpA disulfide reductase family protein n=1 Tax=uncultured Bacteroides sp. TaxID=162156 RepID=UPI0025EEF1D0|nr:TlpA disulfide reductase family protein [uncultured Bacteroides sp.]
MRQFILIITLLLTLACQQVESRTFQSKSAKVTIENKSGKPCYFQPEGANSFERVKLDGQGKCTFNIDLQFPAYYQYMEKSQKTYTVYLTPGSTTEIIETDNGVSIEGDYASVNSFINSNRFLGHMDKNIKLYSAEWQNECRKELDALLNKVSSSGFPEDFVKTHKLYYQFCYYTQLMNAPLMAAFMKMKLDLPDSYYDFLKTVQFNEPEILSLPKWFNTMIDAFNEMEKRGIIPVDKDRFMQIYAAKIGNEKLRSAFLVRLLNLTLEKGYSDNFPAYVESIRSAIIGDKDQAALKETEAKFAQLKENNKEILKGMPAPEFTAVDANGKEYKLSDFAGKVLVLDFWFTGCVPCKMEMPYMEKIAESMKSDPIQFISMSLDSGEQLLSAWKGMVKDQNGPVLNLNMPGGFKSALAKKFGIRSVPRIVIIDQQGNIYDSNALRPSDPKLKQTLEALLGKSDVRQEVQKVMMTLMQAATAEQKEDILRSAIEKYKSAPEALPMLNMMTFQTIKACAKEKKYELVDTYINRIPQSAFRRDVVFIIGCTYNEDGTPDKALPLIKEAAETTVHILKITPEDADEKDKLVTISGAYGNLLVSLGKLTEAEKWVEQAYGNGQGANFDLQKSYAAVQLYKKEYAKASLVLESIFKNGMGTDALKTQLKEAYVGTNGSDKGFDKFLNGLVQQSAEKQKEEVKKRMVNEPAPLFTLKNMKGEEVSLAALKGKVVILDFWATWCGPCKSSFPAMQKAIDKYKNNKDVAFLFIDTWESSKDPLPEVKKFIEEHNYSFNVLFDLKDPVSKKNEVVASYGPKGIPAKYIIDKEGNIRFKLVGFSGSDEQAVGELSEMIDILL